MSTTTAPTTTPAEPVVVVPEAPRSNTIGLVALGLAIVGFILAIFLLTAGLAWMLLIPAIGLAIAGLIIPNRRRGVAVAALIVGVMGLLLSFVGFRLPVGSLSGQEVVLNNDGVNPFSQFTGPLPGQQIGGLPGSNPGAGGATGATGTNGSGVEVTVSSVDCHQPLATVTGLNITGEVCAVTLTATNNGTELVSIDSSNITANADGSLLAANVDVGEGPLLQADINPGESTTGLVYVNAPTGTTGLDAITIDVGGDTGSNLVNVDLEGVGINGLGIGG